MADLAVAKTTTRTKSFSNNVLADLDTAVNDFIIDLEADPDHVYTVSGGPGYYAGADHVRVIFYSYVEQIAL